MLSDIIVALKVKRKLYKTVVIPAMMYESEGWAINTNKKIKKNFAQMLTLRQICGVTRLDGIRNEYIGRKLGITNIVG